MKIRYERAMVGSVVAVMHVLFLCFVLIIPLPLFLVAEVSAAGRTINFSGYTWIVKSGYGGPGPNWWSNSEKSVWVDGDGRLHLKTVRRNGVWHSCEVYLPDSLGYGEYAFHLATRVDMLHSHVVFGLFLYESDRREIDAEFSNWGEETRYDVGRYVISPSNLPGHLHRFPVSLNGDYSTHVIDWTKDTVRFRSLHGHNRIAPNEGYVIEDWGFQGSGEGFLRQGQERVHINLWFYGGCPYGESCEQEVVVDAFEFTEEVSPLSISTPVDQYIPQGGSAIFQFRVARVSSSGDTVNLRLLNEPVRATVSWSQNPVAMDAVVVLIQLTIQTDCNVAPRSYDNLQIVGFNGEISTVSGTFSLTVESSQNCQGTLSVSLLDPPDGSRLSSSSVKFVVYVSSGEPVEDAIIRIYLDGQEICSGNSDARGYYSCNYAVGQEDHVYSWHCAAEKSGYESAISATWNFAYSGDTGTTSMSLYLIGAMVLFPVVAVLVVWYRYGRRADPSQWKMPELALAFTANRLFL